MKIRKLILMVGLIISFLAVNACLPDRQALAHTDNKYHSEFVLKHKLNDKFDLFFNPEVRFKNDMGNGYYQQYRLGTTFHVHKYLDLTGAYRFVEQKDTKSDWSNSDMQYIELIAAPKIKLSGFNLSDANKIEYRFLENSRDRWVYRNLVTAAYPSKIFGFEWTPYISNEIYYDFEIDKMNLNWATAGANKKINKNLTLGLYFRNEASRVGSTAKWVTNYILGSNVTVDF